MAADAWVSSSIAAAMPDGFVPSIATSGAVGNRATEVVQHYRTDELMGLPLLDSLPQAPRTLFLDFTGSFEKDWWQTIDGHVDHYTNLRTPAYDTNGNPATFDADEQRAIRNIWAAVAEDFAPFNINVTTHYDGSLEDGNALKVVIGGDGDWLDRAEGVHPTGTSEIRSYLTSAPNTVFVFSENFGNNTLYQSQIATTASHEAGHALSLVHHSVWSADGKKVINPYDPGTNEWTPIMGQNTSADRTTWSRGVTEQGPHTSQDDFAILGGLLGFRPDEQGTTTLPAGFNAALNAPLTSRGHINTTNDVDTFQFTTGGGQVNILVSAIEFGANLLPRAELWSSNGRIMVGTFNLPTKSLSDPKQSIISVTLPAGTYYIRVCGGGDYGDVGQYTVKVTTTLATVAGGSPKRQPLVGTTSNITLTNVVQQTSTSGKTATGKTASSDGVALATIDTVYLRPVTKSPSKRDIGLPTDLLPSNLLYDDNFFKAVDAVFAEGSFHEDDNALNS